METNNDEIKETNKDLMNSKRYQDKCTIFVKNINYLVVEGVLESFFSKFGKVVKAQIIRNSDKSCNYSKHSGFGFVQFENIETVTKVLSAQPNQLILKDFGMKVRQYERKTQPKKTVHKISTYESSVTATDRNCFINLLPADILTIIFSKLCLRDLCIVERVCKLWREIAQITWSFKSKLILSQDQIYGGYTPKNEPNPYGFKKLPIFNDRSFQQILRKKIGSSLKILDFSNYTSFVEIFMFKSIIEKLPNLEYINMSRIDISNKCLREVVALENLKELNLASCTRIKDATISAIFKKCKHIKTLDLTLLDITGECLVHAPNTLRKIVLDECLQITDQNLKSFFSQQMDLEYLSLKGKIQYTSNTILSILNNYKKLKTLRLSETSFSNLSSTTIEEINFEQLNKFTELELTNSIIDVKFIQKLLSTSKTLKRLDLSYCTKLTDIAFSKFACPLEVLTLNYLNLLTRETLKYIQDIPTLKELRIKGCSRFQNQDIIDTMLLLPKLSLLEVRNNTSIDNLLLDAALDLDRPMRIYCIDTKVNTMTFEYKYPTCEKTHVDFQQFMYKYKNLTFDVNPTVGLLNKVKDPKIWKENGIYMMNSDSEDSDLWDNLNEAANPSDPNYYDYDDRDHDFFDDDDEVPEMYNEFEECT